MKRVIPLGNRLLVRRRRIGEKLGSGLIVASQETADRPIDLADVVHVPEHSFADKELIGNAESIVKSLTEKAKNGDSEALRALVEFNFFLKIKSIKVGDCVFLSKYVGTDFVDNETQCYLTLVAADDLIGTVREE